MRSAGQRSRRGLRAASSGRTRPGGPSWRCCIAPKKGLTASRFGEYLSHGQKEQPYGWERLLVDAAVIGGKDRWERRLSGLAEQLRVRLAQAEDDSARERIDRQLERLARLRAFALPLIEQLDSLRAPRRWGEWLDGLRALAETALDDPKESSISSTSWSPCG